MRYSIKSFTEVHSNHISIDSLRPSCNAARSLLIKVTDCVSHAPSLLKTMLLTTRCSKSLQVIAQAMQGYALTIHTASWLHT